MSLRLLGFIHLVLLQQRTKLESDCKHELKQAEGEVLDNFFFFFSPEIYIVLICNIQLISSKKCNELRHLEGVCLLGAFSWRFSGHDRVGGDPGADPEHAGGFIYFIGPGRLCLRKHFCSSDITKAFFCFYMRTGQELS